MELNPGEISLMSAGACGAFVHGLEDEFMGKNTHTHLDNIVHPTPRGSECCRWIHVSIEHAVEKFCCSLFRLFGRYV